MLKLSENPAILTPEVQSLNELTGTWWVAYTKPRFEKAFAWDMLSRGIGYFLPMREKITFSGGRKRHVMVLEVKILGQGAVVEIDSDLLEPME